MARSRTACAAGYAALIREAMTFTGAIGRACLRPLRAIIAPCVTLRIHPNILTVTGVVINVIAAWLLALRTSSGPRAWS